MYEETARRLKEALERKGLTQQDLADLSGVNKASISQYVNGSHAPGNISSYKMAQVLGVSAPYLMGFDSTPMPLSDEYCPASASLVSKIRQDKELTEALTIYFSLPKDKKKYVTDLIKMLAD